MDIDYLKRVRGGQLFSLYMPVAKDKDEVLDVILHEIAIRAEDDPHRHVLTYVRDAVRDRCISANGLVCFAGYTDGGRMVCEVVTPAAPVEDYVFSCGSQFVVYEHLIAAKRNTASSSTRADTRVRVTKSAHIHAKSTPNE